MEVLVGILVFISVLVLTGWFRSRSKVNEREDETTMEHVLMRAEGSNGIVEILDGKVKIKRKGGGSIFTHGLQGEKDILTSRISSIQFKKCGSLTSGYIQFAFLGGLEAKSGIFEAAQDENTVMFNQEQENEFVRIKQAIESRMQSASASTQNRSSLTDLETLASLRDKGIINEEEFEAKKRQLLAA